MTTYEQRILGRQPKDESYGESLFTAVLMVVMFVMLVGIIYMIPSAI